MTHGKRLLRILSLVLALAPLPLFGGDRLLTLADIYDPEKKIGFQGSVASGVSWIDDASYIWPKTNARGEVEEVLIVEARSGESRKLYEIAALQQLLAEKSGISAEKAGKLVAKKPSELTPSKDAMLLNAGSDLWLYRFSDGALERLTSTPEAEEKIASFSPDGGRVAFVRANDLFVVDVATRRERRLTTDGSDLVLNGILDWVYQEEIYGRGNFKGYWWNPDGSRLAFLRLLEHEVPTFTLVDDVPLDQKIEVERYPQAGDPNPGVELWLADASGSGLRKIDTSRYAETPHLIVSVAWAPDGRRVVWQIQDRIQSWLDLNATAIDGMNTATLFRETTPAWVERIGDPEWLEEGSFLWLSERDGWKHIYRYSPEGRLVKQLTKGKWEVRSIERVVAPWIYFTATARSPIAPDVYRVRFDGSGMQRLSPEEGWHDPTFNQAGSLWIDRWSNVVTPTRTVLRDASGKLLRTVDANRVDAISDFALVPPELFTIPTRDGFPMEAMLIRPPDFDPSKKYPVYQHTYAGPQAPQVRNAWGREMGLFHQLLAQRGIVVFIVDNRTASGKGAVSAWPAYRNFGELELRDLEDGVAWLKRQPWADASRIMLNGWSFGGYMTSYALTHSRAWKAGIAGGSVTDWRAYDSIYTERYMGMPQENEEGYAKSAPRNAAGNLHGTLLLIHGMMDDNVHPQNTIQFADDLMRAGKQFRLMLYPKARHGVTDPKLVMHMRQMMLEFVEEQLKGSD